MQLSVCLWKVLVLEKHDDRMIHCIARVFVYARLKRAKHQFYFQKTVQCVSVQRKLGKRVFRLREMAQAPRARPVPAKFPWSQICHLFI